MKRVVVPATTRILIRFILKPFQMHVDIRAVKQYIGAQYIGIGIGIITIIGKKANILIIDHWQICYIVLQYIGPILVIV